jgi:hypothetical protein
MIGRPRLALVLALLLASSGARAQPLPEPVATNPAARAHLAAGLRLYAEGRYEEAAAEIEAAQSIEPRPDHLYTLGQIARHRNDCPRAVDYFRAYIASTADVVSGRAAEILLEECQQKVPKAARPRAPVPVGPTHEQTRRSRTAAIVLLAGSVAFAGAGAGLLGDAHRRIDLAPTRYDLYQGAASWVPGETIAGWVAVGVAGFLLGAGLVELLHRRAPAVRALLAPGLAALAVEGSF